MCPGGEDTHKLTVLVDIPKKLQAQLNDGLKPIDVDCLRENAELMLGMFETICLEHVLGSQVDQKLLRKLVQRNPNQEKGGDKEKLLSFISKIAQSSLIAQDPWGDKAV